MNQLLLSILFLLLPTQLGLHFWPEFSFLNGLSVDFLSPTLHLNDCLLILLFVFNFKSFFKTSLKLRDYLYPILLIFLLNYIISLNHLITSLSIARLLLYSSLVIIFHSQHKKDQKSLLTLLLVSSIASIAIAILQLLFQSSLGGVFYYFGERSFNFSTIGVAKLDLPPFFFIRPYSSFSHPNSLAGFLLVVFSLTRSRLFRIILSLGVFLTFSKAAIFALLLYLILKKSPFTLLDLTKVFLFASPLLIFLLHAYSPLNSLSVSERAILNSASIQSVFNHPLGSGFGNHLLSQLPYNSNLVLSLQPSHHLLFILLTEFGLLFFPLFLSFFKLIDLKKMPLSWSFIFITGAHDHYSLTLIQNQLLLTLVIALSLRKNITKLIQSST